MQFHKSNPQTFTQKWTRPMYTGPESGRLEPNLAQAKWSMLQPDLSPMRDQKTVKSVDR